MSGMTCDVTGCIWNDGNGGCGCDGIYISDVETGEPMCESASFPQDEEQELVEESQMENKNRYIELAKYCIGLDRKKPYIRHGKKFYRPYRNFFATGKNYIDWETIKQEGYAYRDKAKNQHGGYTYHLNRDGLDWIGGELGIHIYDESD